MWRHNKSAIVMCAIFTAFLLSFLYLSARVFFFVISDIPISIKVLASLLLFTEVFAVIHSTGYFLDIIKVIQNKNVMKPLPPLNSFPEVAILIPSYKEPISVLKDTLLCCYNLTYPNAGIYLLDDTRYDKPWDTPENIAAYRRSVEELCDYIGVSLFRRRWRGAKAGIVNDFLKFLNDESLSELEFIPSEKYRENKGNPKYIIVFDADMNPFPDFVEPLAAFMEEDPKLAFIQTPQYYSNFEFNKIANASGYQQLVFFEYICEAKGLSEAMFCCGTNVMLRREALAAVGGFDESSVTEDIATSFKMHMQGWKSSYYNKTSAFGMGPEDLGAYFKQQFRWALGTLSLGKYFIAKSLKYFFQAPNKRLWWEYFLSYTHYLIGCSYFVMLIFPMFFLFFNLPIYIIDPLFYVAVFFPYFIFSVYLVIWSLLQRKHQFGGLITGLFLLLPITFPVYMKAAFYALFNIKSAFVVTPKTRGEILPLSDLRPQLLALLACAAAIMWGLERLYYERSPIFGLIGNIFWCSYNFSMLSMIFYFNRSD